MARRSSMFFRLKPYLLGTEEFSKLYVLRRGFRSTAYTQQQASNTKNVSSGDTRLAGRRRFYKSTGILEVEAPWETQSTKNNDSSKETIDSPIKSSGIEMHNNMGIQPPTEDGLRSLLNPRCPGSLSTSADSSTKWFGVTLDGRVVRTPMGQILAVPSESLAWAISNEWNSQKTLLQPAQMPLMTLSCTALDQTAGNPDWYRENIMRYLSTDTTCFWADPTEDRVLYRKQQQAWENLHRFVESALGSKPSVAVGASEGLLMSRARRDKNKPSGLPHPDDFVIAASEWLDTLDAWHLTSMHSATKEAKSFLVGMAVIMSSSPQNTTKYDNNDEDSNSIENPFTKDLSKAILASRVEEEFQIENWGLVEGQHDYDRLNSSIQILSANLLTSSIAAENF